MEIYTPKGSMCASCEHKSSNCSHLDFSKMKVIEQIKVEHNELKIVRCTNYKSTKQIQDFFKT